MSAGPGFHSQMGNVCVLIGEAWLLLGSTLTLCPDDSRSELATAGKLLELLCEPSGVSCLIPQDLCLDHILVLKLKRAFRERGVKMFVALDKAGKNLPVGSVVCALALSAAGLAAGLHS